MAFLSNSQKALVVKAIQQVELNCSGEVHVHLDNHCQGDPVQAAIRAFDLLGMADTRLRNGILFYIATKDRKFAVIGDVGIHQIVGQEFWDSVVASLSDRFRDGDYVGGLCDAILLCGDKLKAFFPHQVDDVNEIPDDVTES